MKGVAFVIFISLYLFMWYMLVDSIKNIINNNHNMEDVICLLILYPYVADSTYDFIKGFCKGLFGK